ncbi:hypothetical protein [Pseudonocardia alaniniphila]|uniref:Small secreted hydrophilic protein n=1 Tax=Pseudonocardia alaniniphila TaxID=75291 RepID=A0ABS9TIK1_9PSEU|nr:hypothetical protein [Pseudonocardia alaniniphila]MCH6168126.1 hypothetical protein [Pseudonocardia alaniniphila]
MGVVRLPLTIVTTVLLVIGVVVGVAALGSARTGDGEPLDPITVQAPAAPDPGVRPPEQPPADPQGYVAPPPPVRAGDDDGRGDDGPGDDGPGDDDGRDDGRGDDGRDDDD